MLDASKMAKSDYAPDAGEMCPVCATLHQAAGILETADRIPDESVKRPLIEGAKKMLGNVLDALNGRRTDGLVMEEEEDD